MNQLLEHENPPDNKTTRLITHVREKWKPSGAESEIRRFGVAEYRTFQEDSINEHRYQEPLDTPETLILTDQLNQFTRNLAKDTLPPGLKAVSDRRVDGVGISKRFGKPYYIDASHALAITKEDQPIAFIGFNENAGEIKIIQIQGVKGQTECLNRLGRWEKTLVKLVEKFAEERDDIHRVAIRGASENGWVKMGRMSPQTAKIRYDGTAKRLGYRSDESGGKFVKEIVR